MLRDSLLGTAMVGMPLPAAFLEAELLTDLRLHTRGAFLP